MSTTSTDGLLRERYGVPGGGRSWLVGSVVAALVVAFAGWWAWATWAQANPQVRSELVGFSIESEHRALATIQVVYGEDFVSGTCRITALAEDHSTVGEAIVDLPLPGGNPYEIPIRTDRRATAVTLHGCATPDQPRPR